MRGRLPFSVLTLVALGLLLWWPTGTDASAPGASPTVRVAALAQQLAPPAQSPAQSLVGLSLEETRERVRHTESELEITEVQKRRDDRTLAGARLEVDELRTETETIAEGTVENAIINYRQAEVTQRLVKPVSYTHLTLPTTPYV